MTFDDWYQHMMDDYKATVKAKDCWTAAQQAERERIRARARIAAEKTWKAGGCYVGPQHYIIEKFVDALLEDGDE